MLRDYYLFLKPVANIRQRRNRFEQQFVQNIASMWHRLLPPNSIRTSILSRSRRRCISTTQLDQSIRDFTSELAKIQPVFQIPPSSIRVLREPAQFYDLLLVCFRYMTYEV